PGSRATCDTCGASTPQVRSSVRAHGAGMSELQAARGAHMATCPRCDFQSEGLPYFSRGSHAVALGAATLFTFPLAFGAGGLLYWGLRHNHRVCPRCGLGWGPFGERARVGGTAPEDPGEVMKLAHGGAEPGRRIW